MAKSKRIRLHFEDGYSKPDVFRLTAQRIAAALGRNREAAHHVRASRGHDLTTLGRWLGSTESLTCSADFLADPRFPLYQLASAAPALRWIHVTGAGIEKLLPLDWIHPGLTLTNNSGVHRPKMYEFALMALTMLNARIPALVGAQARREWKPTFTPCCGGRTLVVLGTGDLGSMFARAGRHLGMRVLGVRRTPRATAGFDRVHATRDLPVLLREADVLVVAAPLTPETRGLIGASELGAMKRGAGLVNVGRGKIVDYGALARQLEQGRLSGAILDVFETEPLPAKSPLWRVPNLFISPHCSSDDADEYIPRTLDLVLDNALRLAQGRRLRNRVDPRRAY